MGEKTEISWTDATFNPWWGCTRVSPGCVHCYAETFDRRVHGKDKAHWGVKAERRFFGDKHWNEPLRWNAKAEAAGIRARVFCASMADVGEDRPELVPHRARLALLVQSTPWLDWLLLTKRPENLVRLFAEHWPGDWPSNVWAGCTVEDQKRADERIPELLRVPAAVRFLSCEPLLERVDLERVAHWSVLGRTVDVLRGGTWDYPGLGFANHSDLLAASGSHLIDWVICGGESGHGARPMHPDWARSLRDQCVAAGVAFHFKQWGEWIGAGQVVDSPWPDAHFHRWPGGAVSSKAPSKQAAGRLLDGRTWDELPTPVVTHA